MTPCEKLGYKVGDRFRVLTNNMSHRGCYIGDIVYLQEDDGSDCPYFASGGKDNLCFGIDDGDVEPITTSGTHTLKSGDEITQNGKKYRVTLEEIPQYEFKPGMICRVVWDGSECCSDHTDSDRVVYISKDHDGDWHRVAYAETDGELAIGFVNTSNLRPE